MNIYLIHVIKKMKFRLDDSDDSTIAIYNL